MRRTLVERMAGFGTTIFAEMSALAIETDAINLGQGFPDTDGPAIVRDAAVRAIEQGHNQYPPGIGIPELRRAIVAHQSENYDLNLDPDDEVLVTAGATEAIAAAILGLCDRGDEVVALEPFYDSYEACAALAHARLVGVTLHPPGFALDADALRTAITARTRLLLVNTPHNPTGRVLSAAELADIAEVAIEHDLWVVTDEVYEHLVFDREHIPLATLPGMKERTLTISSAAKTFSVTGWKIGWITGPRELIDAVKTVKQFLTYAGGGPFQHGVAAGLTSADAAADFEARASILRSQRDLLCAGLVEAGFDVVVPEATYFVTGDIRPLGADNGLEFCRQLPHRVGVVAVPHEVFWHRVDIGRPLVRFACCKRPEVLEEAVRRLCEL